MKVDIVIGAGYGDEGKGLTVDWCIPENLDEVRTIVVRSNGSCQAGHTVEYDTGRRTIYQHLGSGMARAVPTYLAQRFVVHPMLFRPEFDKLTTLPGLGREFFRYPTVFVHPGCLVTTPWDMLINQCMERTRSTERHGSVGIGFGETIERCNNDLFVLHVQNLWLDGPQELEARLTYIRDNYIMSRFKNTNFQLNTDEHDIYYSSSTMRNFIKDCQFFVNNTSVQGNIFLSSFDHVIFEGAQGLMLDQDYGRFPYVTRSHTGLRNPMEILRKLTNLTVISDINVYYVTRSYTTRHGAGPLPFELRLPGMKPFSKIEDKTNITGEWQGSLRFGYINLDELNLAISYDINSYADERCKIHGVITCVDQIAENDRVLGIFNKNVHDFGNVTNMLNTISNVFPFTTVFTSSGPTKNTFKQFTRTSNVL